MCGRYSLTTPEEALRRLFRYQGPALNLAPRYNIAPTQAVPVVRLAAPDSGGTGDGARELAMLRWGLIPSWAKEAAIGNRMINARAETVSEKPAFRNAFRERRCLVLADGFYEWTKTNGAKQPYRIHRADDGPFAFAGLWERWRQAGENVESCTIVTTDANDALKPIHHRMPVILDPGDYQAWLDAEDTPRDTAQALLRPYEGGGFASYRIGTHVNNPRNDDAACIAPLDETRLL
jgi:putative SOS response-associated peptidase YedK